MIAFIVAILEVVLRALLPAVVAASKSTAEDGARQPALRARLRARVRSSWGRNSRTPIIALLVGLILVAGATGCGLRTVYVHSGEPVRIRETVRMAKVWVLDAAGVAVPAQMDLLEGWYCLPDTDPPMGRDPTAPAERTDPMKTFNDAAGRTWTLALTLGSAMAIKDKLGMDLLRPEVGFPGPEDPPLLTRLGTDEMLLGEVVCSLLEGQCEAQKTTPAEVRAAFDGAALLAAQEAFYAELVDFFRSRGQPHRARAVEAQMEMIRAAVKLIETRIEAIDVDETIRGVMSGSSPEPSASTPEP